MSKNSKKKPNVKYKVFVIIVLVILVCTSYVIYKNIIANSNQNIYEDVKISDSIEDNDNQKQFTENMKKVITLQQENVDVKAWIQIEDTSINYPILQTTDNEYYLKHNYKKENSQYGSIYLKNECDILNNNSNLIIYGHNMKDGQMFNNLLKYKEKSFYDNHKTIKIATNNEESEYSIVAVFKSRIFYQNENNVFRFYNYINFNDEQTYNEYIENCKKIQLYETGVSAIYGEQLITLITCEYSQENGRMVIVAKKES